MLTIQTRHILRKLVRYAATSLAIYAAALMVDSGNSKSIISAAAEKEIASVAAQIDRVEAEALSQIQKGRLDPSHRIILIGKVIFFDQNLPCGGTNPVLSVTCRRPDSPGRLAP